MTKKNFFAMLNGATKEPKTIGTQDRTLWGQGRPKYTAIVIYWKNTMDPSTIRTYKGDVPPEELQKYQDWLNQYLLLYTGW